jgi:hypothetical protein
VGFVKKLKDLSGAPSKDLPQHGLLLATEPPTVTVTGEGASAADVLATGTACAPLSCR